MSRDRWRQHLNDLMNATLDPVIYAVQWARDPRCMRHGVAHRRVGVAAQVTERVCPLWVVSKRA